MLRAIPRLDLSVFTYISIHAPSYFEPDWEAELWNNLRRVEHDWPIVIHPDAINDFGLWRELGERVCIENMDKRKPIGRTADELAKVFRELPQATFCFDIGHARQVDLTMTEAYLILREFGSRLRQVHVSEVNSSSKHDVLSYASITAFQEVARLIPEEAPLILETPVSQNAIEAEIEKVRKALPTKAGIMVA
jgi:endonuclease IV